MLPVAHPGPRRLWAQGVGGDSPWVSSHLPSWEGPVRPQGLQGRPTASSTCRGGGVSDSGTQGFRAHTHFPLLGPENTVPRSMALRGLACPFTVSCAWAGEGPPSTPPSPGSCTAANGALKPRTLTQGQEGRWAHTASLLVPPAFSGTWERGQGRAPPNLLSFGNKARALPDPLLPAVSHLCPHLGTAA